jgi:hypothetical protein
VAAQRSVISKRYRNKGSEDGSIIAWDLSTPKLIWHQAHRNRASPARLQMIPGATEVAFGDNNLVKIF